MKIILIPMVVCGCLFSGNAFAKELPPIAPGLWEVTSNGANHQGKVKHCIDSATMEKLLTSSQKMLGKNCSEPSMEKTSSGYATAINCNMMGSAVSVSSVLTGDFSKQYTSTTTTSFNPPIMGQAGGTSTETAVRLGDCPAGMQPGDVQLANGQTINTQKMMAEMPDLGSMMEQMQGGQMPDPKEMQRLVEQMQKMKQ